MTSALPPLDNMDAIERAFGFDAEGLKALLSLEELPGISEHPTERGPVVVVHGKQHSGRDPAREALRFVRDLDIAEASALVLYGYGSGYVARALRKKSDARLFIFEPNLAALRTGLLHGPLPENAFFLTSVVAVKTVMYAALGTGDRGQLIPWQPTVRQSGELYQLFAPSWRWPFIAPRSGP